MKNILTVFLFWSLTSFGSDSLHRNIQNIKWVEIPSEFFDFATELIGVDNNNVYVIKHKKKETLLEKYNLRTSEVVQSNALQLTFRNKDLVFKKAIYFKGKIIVFTQYFNKRNKMLYTFKQFVNLTDFSLSTPVIVHQINKKVLFLFLSDYSYTEDEILSDINFTISENKKHGFAIYIALAKNAKSRKKMSKKQIGVYFDENLRVIEKKKLKVPFTNHIVDNVEISNSGQPFFIIKKMSIGKPKGLFRIRRIREKGVFIGTYIDGELIYQELEIDKSKENFDVNLKCVKDNVFVTTINLNDDDNKFDYTCALYDSELNLLNSYLDTTSLAYMARVKTKIKKNKVIKSGYPLDHRIIQMIPHKDNSVTVFIEDNYIKEVVTTTYSSKGSSTKSTYYYYYLNIKAYHFNENMELEWEKTIPKHQVSTNDDGYSSSATIQKDDNETIHILYGQKNAVMHNTLSLEGELYREVVSELNEKNKDKAIKLTLKQYRITSTATILTDGGAIVIARNNKGSIVGEIKF